MRDRQLSYVLTLAAVACSHRATTLQVNPEPPTAPPVPAAVPAQPPPPEGAVTLVTAGGVDVVGLHGRIDRLQIAASGERARLVAEVSGVGAPARATVAVELGVDGALSPPRTLTVGARNTRVVTSVAAAPDGFRTMTFGLRRTETAAPDFGSTHRYALIGEAGAARRTEPMLFEAEELVAAADGERFVAAAVGARILCFEARCADDYRENSGLFFHPRSAFEVQVVGLASGTPIENIPLIVRCPTPAVAEPDRPATLVSEGQVAPDRCRAQRRARPYDVALAVSGGRTLVAYRTDGSIAALNLGADPIDASPVVVSEGQVGAPAVAWRGEAVVLVWAQRASDGAPYALHAVEWNPYATARPPAPTVIATGAASAFAPALVVRGSQVVLAWMEGDDRAASVRVGATRRSIEHAVDHAVTVSTGGNARDPELAGSAAHAWIAWSEYPVGRSREQGGGAVRASRLGLP